MRADRLLSILLLLQDNERVTARELAARFEVSARTIHRDMDALSAAGVPVFARRGAGGGWSLAGDYRTDPTGLNDAEVRALVIAKPPRLLADLGLARAAEAGIIKLLAALPAAHRQDAEHVRQRIHVDVAGWRRREEAVPLLPAIQAAVLADRRLRLRYERGREVVERVVDPLGLVAKGSIWYMIAAVAGDVRTYRVSRVVEVEELPEASRRPADFDLAAYWAASQRDFVAHLPRFAVTVLAEPGMLDALHAGTHWSRVEAVTPPGADGRHRVSLRFELPEDAVTCLLGLGPGVEVVAPEETRAEIARRAALTVTRYRERPPAAAVLSSPGQWPADDPGVASLPSPHEGMP